MDPIRFGPYTISARLGRGGMGTVYEAADASGTPVAVKTLTAHLGDDPALRRRFEAEIEALKALRHPGIVRLLAFGEEEGRPFFAMELVAGRSLEEILKGGQRFEWRRTVAVAGEITRALKSAHDQGIVHRDLKPANLLFPDQPGAGVSVKLADFGIARLFGDAGHTQAGTVVGTAEYMAPEQAAGEPVDARADLYALGLVMFAMLTGRPPFRGGSVSEVLRRQRAETPPRVAAMLPEIPPAVDELIARLLAKAPADRPASALAVGRMLAAIEAAPPATGPASATVHDAGSTVSDRPTVDGGGVDLLAATRSGGTDAAARLTIPFDPGGGQADGEAATRAAPATRREADFLAHRPTAPDNPPGSPGPARVASRFTTVEELHEAARRQAERTARRDGLLRLFVAAGLLAAVVAVGSALLRPATADQLHARIVAIAAEPAADRRDARPLIDLFLDRFPHDPRAEQVRRLDRELQLDALEKRSRRRPRDQEVLDPLERDYRAAMDREPESPLACRAALEAILALHGEGAGAAAVSAHEASRDETADATLWLGLVRRQIDRIEPLAEREREEDVARADATLAQAAALASEAAEANDAARTDLLGRRRQLLRGLVEIYGNRLHVAAAVTEARRLLDADAPPPSSPDAAP